MFSKANKQEFRVPRLWLLEGEAGIGKSTFASQMRGPLLPIDADHRFPQVYKWVEGEVYDFSNNPVDHTDYLKISKLLETNMDSSVGTIIVDSLTAILTPYVVRAIVSNDAGENKNRVASFKEKAMVVRTLQDSITRWGCDVLWISHIGKGLNNQAKETDTYALTPTEYKRLLRSLNARLKMIQQGGKRGIEIVWSREGKTGTLWDTSDHWVGMPERIEAILKGEVEKKVEHRTYTFPSQQAALDWASSLIDRETAQEVYAEIKEKDKPKTAIEMFQIFGEKVTSIHHIETKGWE